MTISIPSQVRITEYDIRPTPVVVSQGPLLNGRPDWVNGPDAIWTARLSVVIPFENYPAWEAFLDRLEGMVNSFDLEPPSSYTPPGLTAAWTMVSGATTYTTTGGATTYTTTSPDGGATLRHAQSQYADTIRIEHTGKGTSWANGDTFKIGTYNYRVTEVISASANEAELRILPRLRANHIIGDKIRNPALSFSLSDLEGARGVKIPGANFRTLDLVEAF